MELCIYGVSWQIQMSVCMFLCCRYTRAHLYCAARIVDSLTRRGEVQSGCSRCEIISDCSLYYLIIPIFSLLFFVSPANTLLTVLITFDRYIVLSLSM